MEKQNKRYQFRVLRVAGNVLLFLWQLPQNLIGLCIWMCRHRDDSYWYKRKLVGIDDRFVSNKEGDKTHNGISLGLFIILEKYRSQSLEHEYGHCRQSEYLGWLYLPTVGICSGVHNLVNRYKRWRDIPQKSYYAFWTERWADKLAQITRK